jgi:hypothetical protein
MRAIVRLGLGLVMGQYVAPCGGSLSEQDFANWIRANLDPLDDMASW